MYNLGYERSSVFGRSRMTISVVLVLWLATVNTLSARHIIGGEMNYVCLGNDRYRITMKVYRDCFGGGADFDSDPGTNLIGTVSVFLGGQIYEPLRTVALPAPRVRRIEPLEGECLLIPPNVCVEEGVYEFEVNLPASNLPYTISYQRCCRNNSINNMVDPGATGTTYTVEITPQAQALCNSSIEFSNFPPIVICAGERLIFDHSAVDLDTAASDIVYSLCAPFTGGGLAGSEGQGGSAQDPNGVAPNPETAPPYTPVNFISPTYSVTNPLGIGSEISIDPNTGELVVEPQLLGQFVVGICASEFRDGILMSQIRRDFQFNVTQCSRLVFADIEADGQSADGTFEILSCDGNTVTINNLSTQESAIDEYLWIVEGVEESPFSTRDLTVTFPDTGFYSITMILNPNSIFERCKDTAEIEIGVFGTVDGDFTADYDTCMEEPVIVVADVVSENGAIVDYAWTFEEGAMGGQVTTSHQYEVAGTYPINLVATDVKGCRLDVTNEVDYFPVPDVLLVRPNRFLACVPEEIQFQSLNPLLTEEFELTWFFGDGGVGTGLTPTHLYDEAGIYDVTVHVLSPLGCETEATFQNLVEMRQSPIADFVFAPQVITSISPDVTFTSTSQFTDGVQWFAGDGGVGFEPVFEHTYRDSGLFEVQLVAFNQEGCTDTAIQIIDVVPFSSYFLPNAFTPNDDGVNDVYIGTGISLGIRTFQMQIFNRWGELVYETDDPSVGWNGRKDNLGEPAPKGVYQCLVNITSTRGESSVLEQEVTLLR